MVKKFEKITLTTAIETYRDANHHESLAMSALDELLPIIEKHLVESNLIDWEHLGCFELTKVEPEPKESEAE